MVVNINRKNGQNTLRFSSYLAKLGWQNTGIFGITGP